MPNVMQYYVNQLQLVQLVQFSIIINHQYTLNYLPDAVGVCVCQVKSGADGRNLLYFGCRRREQDFLYRTELGTFRFLLYPFLPNCLLWTYLVTYLLVSLHIPVRSTFWLKFARVTVSQSRIVSIYSSITLHGFMLHTITAVTTGTAATDTSATATCTATITLSLGFIVQFVQSYSGLVNYPETIAISLGIC